MNKKFRFSDCCGYLQFGSVAKRSALADYTVKPAPRTLLSSPPLAPAPRRDASTAVPLVL